MGGRKMIVPAENRELTWFMEEVVELEADLNRLYYPATESILLSSDLLFLLLQINIWEAWDMIDRIVARWMRSAEASMLMADEAYEYARRQQRRHASTALMIEGRTRLINCFDHRQECIACRDEIIGSWQRAGLVWPDDICMSARREKLRRARLNGAVYSDSELKGLTTPRWVNAQRVLTLIAFVRAAQPSRVSAMTIFPYSSLKKERFCRYIDQSRWVAV